MNVSYGVFCLKCFIFIWGNSYATSHVFMLAFVYSVCPVINTCLTCLVFTTVGNVISTNPPQEINPYQ